MTRKEKKEQAEKKRTDITAKIAEVAEKELKAGNGVSTALDAARNYAEELVRTDPRNKTLYEQGAQRFIDELRKGLEEKKQQKEEAQ